MKRRTLFTSGALLALGGCTGGLEPDPAIVPSTSPAQGGARPGDYAILLDNFGAGEDPHQRDGVLCLIGPDGALRGHTWFRPMDNARLISNNGAVAWMANDAAHHWSATHTIWAEMPYAGGAVDTILPAGNHVVAVINIGSSDGQGYESGLVEFNGDDFSAWDYTGKLSPSTGATATAIVGFSAPGLSDQDLQLTVLTRDAEHVRFGPKIETSLLWGSRMVHAQDRICLLAASAFSGQAGTVWLIDPDTQSIDIVNLTGEAGAVDSWFSEDGPSQLIAVDHQLYWRAGPNLWSADPLTGQSRRVMSLDGTGWFLEPSGLIQLERQGPQATLKRYDPVDGSHVETVNTDALPDARGVAPVGAVLIAP